MGRQKEKGLKGKGGDAQGKEGRQAAVDAAAAPAFCDYSCRHAEFPPEDAVGACRRELAVWCTALGRFNNKNNRCLLRA